MTVYGGEEQYYGTRKDGFFVNCTKCGWHSKTEVTPSMQDGKITVNFYCGHCKNTHMEE